MAGRSTGSLDVTTTLGIEMSVKQRQRGFTILEIVIVFILLAGIMAFVGPKIFEQMDRAKVEETKMRLMHVAERVQLYQAENKTYPRTLEDLLKNPSGGMPYIKPEDLKDAWGNDIRYTVPGNGQPFEVTSLGADGREGGDGANKDLKKP
jgi:general secretion pathway protein G